MSINEIKARIASGGNIKLGSQMGTFSKLAGDEIFQTKYGPVFGSCGKYCKYCKGRDKCYVFKSYRYGSVINGQARNTLAFRIDLEQAFSDIQGQLSRKRKPFKNIRINQAGEIENTQELINWIATASMFPDTYFYLYTKNFDAIREVVKIGFPVPDNFTVLVSIWHEYGIPEYMEFRHLSWIKAFIYDDGFNYSEYGLEIETYCKAYNEAGKLDHNVTCEKCQKCLRSKYKLIGCYSH